MTRACRESLIPGAGTGTFRPDHSGHGSPPAGRSAPGVHEPRTLSHSMARCSYHLVALGRHFGGFEFVVGSHQRLGGRCSVSALSEISSKRACAFPWCPARVRFSPNDTWSGRARGSVWRSRPGPLTAARSSRPAPSRSAPRRPGADATRDLGGVQTLGPQIGGAAAVGASGLVRGQVIKLLPGRERPPRSRSTSRGPAEESIRPSWPITATAVLIESNLFLPCVRRTCSVPLVSTHPDT